MATQKAFLKYKGITLCHGLKADGELDFIYTRKRNNYVEGGEGWFETTRLPKNIGGDWISPPIILVRGLLFSDTCTTLRLSER